MDVLNVCDFLKEGFYIRQSENHFSVVTPQTFASGDPARFWVIKDFNGLVFNDYGFAHNALELSIPQPEKADDIIKSTLAKLDTKIDFNGVELKMHVPEKMIAKGMGDFLNLYALLTNYKPKTPKHQEQLERLDAIYIYLLKKYKDVEANPKFKGASGIEHKFAFKTEQTLVDFSTAHSQSTGAILRKIQDVKTIYDDMEYSIILDDSNLSSFKKESRILSTIASVTPYSVVEKMQ